MYRTSWTVRIPDSGGPSPETWKRVHSLWAGNQYSADYQDEGGYFCTTLIPDAFLVRVEERQRLWCSTRTEAVRTASGGYVSCPVSSGWVTSRQKLPSWVCLDGVPMEVRRGIRYLMDTLSISKREAFRYIRALPRVSIVKKRY